MIDSERFKLFFGPYVPPECAVGDKLACERRGREVTVNAISWAPVPWPCARGGGTRGLILCGDLIRAVRFESPTAVAYHWGVHRSTIVQWRRALEAPRMTLGSGRLRRDYWSEILTLEERSVAEASKSPAVPAEFRASAAGRRLYRKMIAAQRLAVRRARAAERMLKLWEHPEQHGLPPCHHWTEEEIALLGKESDGEVARRLGIPKPNVTYKRRSLGIPNLHRRRPWTKKQIALLGTAIDSEVGRKVRKSRNVVRKKRQHLGIPAFKDRWTEEEISRLGVDTDRAVAKALGRSRLAVARQRLNRGIPPYRDSRLGRGKNERSMSRAPRRMSPAARAE
jgi:hypothetical protein